MSGRDRNNPAFRHWKSSTQLKNLEFFYCTKALPLDLIADLLGMPKARITEKARRMKLRRPFLFTEPTAPEEGRPHGSAPDMDRA
jgi:hypothetical protein